MWDISLFTGQTAIAVSIVRRQVVSSCASSIWWCCGMWTSMSKSGPLMSECCLSRWVFVKWLCWSDVVFWVNWSLNVLDYLLIYVVNYGFDSVRRGSCRLWFKLNGFRLKRTYALYSWTKYIYFAYVEVI